MRALRVIEKSWFVAVSCLCSHVCISISTSMSHLKSKKLDSKSRAPVLKRLCNPQNGDLFDTKGSCGQDIYEGGHSLRYVHEG